MMYQLERRHFLSPDDMALLGVEDVAYIKAVTVDSETRFAIHAANGEELAILEDRAVAAATVRQHDLEPLSVH